MKKLMHRLGPVVGVVLFAAALVVLRQALREYHYHEVLRRLEEIPARSLLLALFLTVLNYVVLTGYDRLAFRYIRRPLAYGRIAFASFVGYAFSFNVGPSLLGGIPARFGLYASWGVPALEITRVVAFVSLTLWLGFFTVAGFSFVLQPPATPAAVLPAAGYLRPLGALFLLLAAGYLVWCLRRKRPVAIRGWEFPVPAPRLALLQIAVSTADWALAGGVLYALLPASALTFWRFLGFFLLAQLAGLASQVPGGLGVFETAMLLLLSPWMGGAAAAGSLFAFRAVYYLLPLVGAALLLGLREALARRRGLRRLALALGRRIPELAPRVLSFTVFLGGAVLLFSGAAPPAHGRLAWLKDFLPLPLIEVSHFLGSLIGAALLILARGLQRRLDAAWVLTSALLAAGAAVSLMKGFDYEEAAILALMLAALLPSRRHFYRRASFTGQPLSPGVIAAIAMVVLSSFWLGLFAYRHVAWSRDLWWRFALHEDAPRFLRATVGSLGVLLLFALARLFSPAPGRAEAPGEAELEAAWEVVAAWPGTSANLALLGDKALLFSGDRSAFLMYGVEGRSWIALGDPCGRPAEAAELAWRLRELADRHGGWTVFYEVGEDRLPLYRELGLSPLKIGEEARVPLAGFTLEGGERKGLRHGYHKAEAEGCSFGILPREEVPGALPELKAVSDAWLLGKGIREKRFSLGFWDERYLRRYPAAVVRREGRVIAFANVWEGAGREELSVDLMRYLPDAPVGVMDYLFLSLMLRGQKEGFRWFSLGMAPLAGVEADPRAPLWSRLGHFIYRHGENFYNFQGLRRYKDKFMPAWEPRYLAAPGGIALPRVLANLSALISGGYLGIVAR